MKSLILLFIGLMGCEFIYPALLLAKSDSKTNPSENPTQNDAPFFSDEESMIIFFGERKIITIDGTNPFAADDTMIRLDPFGESQVAITPLRGGTTQILFWKDGSINSKNINIILPAQFSSVSAFPRFIAKRPFFTYVFGKPFSYDDENKFSFDSPYTHYLNSYMPLGPARINATIGFEHTGVHESEILANSFNMQYNTKKVIATVGNTGGTISTLPSPYFGGASVFGSDIRIMDHIFFRNSSSLKEELNLSGGVASISDFRDLTNEDQFYSIHYHIKKDDELRFFQNSLGGSVFTYEKENGTFDFGGVLDGSYNLSQRISLGNIYNIHNTGFASSLFGFYESPDYFLNTGYTFIIHGLENTGGTINGNDVHGYFIGQQIMLPHNFVFGNQLTESISIYQNGSATPSSNTLSFSNSLQRYLSPRNSYGATYGLGLDLTDSDIENSHRATVSWNHPLSLNTYMAHHINYLLSNANDTSHAMSVNNQFSYETQGILFDYYLTNIYSREDDSNETSLVTGISTTFNLGRGNLNADFSYLKSSFEDDLHQFIFDTSFLYNITTTHSLGLSNRLSHSVGGLNQRFSVDSFITYKHVFGPGVQRDSIFKALAGRGGNRQDLKGVVFVDKNYNGYFDKSDIPLNNAVVVLNGKKTVVAKNGEFLFPTLKVGDHKISVDASKLDLNNNFEKTREMSLYNSGTSTINLPIYFQERKATVAVKSFLDTNDNEMIDEEDEYFSLMHILLDTPDGQTVKASGFGGGAIFRGIDIGLNTIKLDQSVLPSEANIIGPPQQQVDVTEYTNYETSFLFKPLRSLRGQIRMVDEKEKNIFKKLIMKIGENKSKVDDQGYYWLENLKPGSYQIEFENLPSNFCMPPNQTSAINIPKGLFTQNLDIQLTTSCPTLAQ